MPEFKHVFKKGSSRGRGSIRRPDRNWREQLIPGVKLYWERISRIFFVKVPRAGVGL